MTVTRMATQRGPIPVTVDTFQASGGRCGGVGGDSMGAEGGNAAQTHIEVWNLSCSYVGPSCTGSAMAFGIEPGLRIGNVQAGSYQVGTLKYG